MTMKDKRETVINFVEQCNGKIFTCTFIKKTTGEVREMTCRNGVFKYSKGGESGSAHCPDILGTYDITLANKLPEEKRAAAYRSIGMDGVLSLKCGARQESWV